jgi:signal peptidase II
MKQSRLVTNIAVFLILIANIGCDQISKKIVRQKVDYRESISLIGNYFTLTKVENKGALLSIGSNLPATLKFVLLSGIPILTLLFGIGYLFLRKNITVMSMVALSFAIGGGIGNIYDRVIHGSVTDFLHIDLVIFRTGIFNMADVSLMVAMGLFLIQSFIHRKQTTTYNAGES